MTELGHTFYQILGNSIKRLQRLLSKTLDQYCVCCELLSASIADAFQFVNMVCLPQIAEQNTHGICLTQECLQIVRRLLWKQKTTHSLRTQYRSNVLDSNLCKLFIEFPSKSYNKHSAAFNDWCGIGAGERNFFVPIEVNGVKEGSGRTFWERNYKRN